MKDRGKKQLAVVGRCQLSIQLEVKIGVCGYIVTSARDTSLYVLVILSILQCFTSCSCVVTVFAC
jgi:hypothetical protein